MGLLGTPAFEQDDTTLAAPTTPTTSLKPQGKPMSSNAPIQGTKVVTGVIRGSYCHLFSPAPQREEDKGKDQKYTMTLLIPKTDTVTLNKIAAAQLAAADLFWPTKKPAKIETTLHDGDGLKPSTGEPYGDECKGHMVIAVASKFKPKMIDRQNNEIIDPSSVGSGDYFKASINFYGYDNKGRRGVSAGLNNLLFWEKGVSLGGASNPQDDFADDIVKS